MAGIANRVGGVFIAGIASYAAYHTLHTKIWDRAMAVDHRIQAIRDEIPSASSYTEQAHPTRPTTLWERFVRDDSFRRLKKRAKATWNNGVWGVQNFVSEKVFHESEQTKTAKKSEAEQPSGATQK
eukprot:gb/GECG01012418.1/.p1 GENE.gb/GECG01012418.1/~~gb/GECG01012418.1/.p1  ORF type:complete len:126 (+),score=13.80 gb/GECG01012418.1/:1-378(+)